MISPKDSRNWQVSIKDPAAIVEGLDDIMQCVYTILSTIPGSDPLRPAFGSNVYQYLDKPLDQVRGNIVYAATVAVERWEKRIEITGCSVERRGADHIAITINGNVIASAAQFTFTTEI